ncbi:MAG: hypothetical protein CMN30_15285 [Sandaracinus sp.]|nr:hypothetical protein [Sandaracinus sp.]
MSDPLIHARGLTVRRGAREVLRAVDLEVRPGEVLGILGPNGAGKSTLLRALLGLVPATGELRVDGRPSARLSARERAGLLAYVPQRSHLQAGLAVREVVGQGRYAAGGHADDAVTTAALARLGLEGLQERAFPTLSVGEQQRALIARALATGARALLLDEPTAALDVRRALETFALLRELADEGRAVVVVVHGLDEARRVADRLILLREGAVAATGSPREVVAADPIREVYGVELVEGGALGFRLSED